MAMSLKALETEVLERDLFRRLRGTEVAEEEEEVSREETKCLRAASSDFEAVVMMADRRRELRFFAAFDGGIG